MVTLLILFNHNLNYCDHVHKYINPLVILYDIGVNLIISSSLFLPNNLTCLYFIGKIENLIVRQLESLHRYKKLYKVISISFNII